MPLPTNAFAPARRAARAPVERKASGPAVSIFAATVVFAITCGWLNRDRLPINPELGLGYALGASGGTLMLLLTLYSARKRVRWIHNWGPPSHWFRVHMMLGVLGPVLILFHCRFRLGAPNSNVALASMVVVAVSGVVGRYIYSRISHGLYGARASLEELHAELTASAQNVDERLPATSRAVPQLAAFAARARAPRRTIAGRVLSLITLPVEAVWVYRRVLHDLDGERDAPRAWWAPGAARAGDAVLQAVIRTYLLALVREVQFRAYERLFSLWHALHIPLFVMLVLTAVIHVIAVHMY